jgi:adenylate kinase
VIKKRLDTYDMETRPVLDYYGPKIVHTIDSTESPLNVLRGILNILGSLK